MGRTRVARLRGAFVAFVGVALVATGVLGASAFNRASLPSRSVTISLVGDSAAYLALAAGAQHACFVTQAASGKVTLSFASATGCGASATGTGLNAGDGSAKFATYAFHDVLKVTNKGVKTVYVFANVTTQAASPNRVDVDLKSAAGQMTFSEYWATSTTSVQLSTGSSAYVGVRVNATAASGTISAAIAVTARS